MKRKIVSFTSMMIITALFIGVVSCKKDEEKTTFNLTSLKSGSIDMNGATAPDNIPAEPTIVATFNLDVKASTANDNNITITRNYDNAAIPLTITVSGASITIVPDENLGNGALFELKMTGIQSADDQSLTAITRSFTTEGTFVPAGQIAFWNFDDNVNDQVGSFNPSADGIVDLTYENSFTTDAGKCGFFNGTTTIVEIPNGDQLTNTADFTLAFWVKTKSEGHVNENGDPKGHFVLGLGAFHGFQFEIQGSYTECKLAAMYELDNGTTASQDLWFNGSGEYNANGGYVGWTFCKDLTSSGGVEALLKDTWAHVVCTYNGATKIGTMYINGEKMKEQDFNLYDNQMANAVGLKWDGDGVEVVNELALGFIQSRAGTLWDNESWGGYDFPTANHFGGWLDNMRVFHKALTAQEVDLMYSSEKP
ncbi:MAG: Ig-like domain-containing protein [Bacteroidales bacterium]|nr:Ig-like domain-containing protein [Bacteroidales bacterium]